VATIRRLRYRFTAGYAHLTPAGLKEKNKHNT
jgi:hypothetical protein